MSKNNKLEKKDNGLLNHWKDKPILIIITSAFLRVRGKILILIWLKHVVMGSDSC